MENIERLELIRNRWLNQVAQQLASGKNVRESFLDLLENFFDLVITAVKTNDPSSLEPMLDNWILAQTKTEWDQLESSIPPFINKIMLITFDVFNDEWNTSIALSLTHSLLPIFMYISEYSINKETQIHIKHVQDELETVKMNLERLERSKSDFISVAAHELKTPLTLIEGYTAMMRDTLAEYDGNSITGLYLNGIGVGTDRLREIVDDMIDVSLIDNGLLDLNFQPLWMNRLFELVYHDLWESLNERQLNLTINTFEGSDEMIFADGERIFQAIRNVIINAIKYTPDGGEIKIDGRMLPEFLEITITDTGIGIDPDDHLQIFEKFGRLGSVSLHSSGKTKYKGGGPGLGLPITKGIIEAHGGTIWVESRGYNETECPGSTFHILLPMRKTPPDDKAAKLFQSFIDDNNS
jgi:signal transduction histidine kinase